MSDLNEPRGEGDSDWLLVVQDPYPIVRISVSAVVKVHWEGAEVVAVSRFEDAQACVHKKSGAILVSSESAEDGCLLDFLGSPQWKMMEASCLVFSDDHETSFGPRALRMGASGFVPKTAEIPRLIAAIDQVRAGGTHWSPGVQRLALQAYSMRQGNQSSVGSLSSREFQIFRLLGQGLIVTEVASTCGISPKTVNSHRENIKEKLGISSSSKLAIYASTYFRGGVSDSAIEDV